MGNRVGAFKITTTENSKKMKSSKILETIQDPWTGVKKWFADAQKCGLNNYNAVTLSTSDRKGKVSSRVVLVKKISEKEGFFFYTNLQSHKGKQLKKNPYVSMLAYWDKLNRQIRIEGKCSFLSQKQTEIYFFTRDKESQIGAWASKQSKELKTREELLENYSYYEKKFLQLEKIPLPKYWRGITLIPSVIEFWQAEDFRLHDRVRFIKKKGLWNATLLFP